MPQSNYSDCGTGCVIASNIQVIYYYLFIVQQRLLTRKVSFNSKTFSMKKIKITITIK